MADTKVNLIIAAKDQASGVISSFAGKTRQGMQQVNSALISVAKVGAVSLLGLGVAGVKVAGDFEQLRISFTNMLGGGNVGLKKANALMQQLTDFSAKTPFELGEIASAAKSLLAFGFSAEKIQPTLRRLGDISAGLNIPIRELSEIYGKARVQGRLFMEDINQLTGRGIPIISELAHVLGVSESKVRDMVTAGKVGFPELEKAFARMTDKGGQFAGLMEAQSTSLFGILSTLKDNVSLTLGKIVEDSGAFDIVKEAITRLNNYIGGNQKGIIDFFTRVGNAIDAFMGLLSGKKASNPFKGTFKWLEDNGDTIINIINGIRDVVSQVIQFFNDHAETITAFASNFAKVAIAAIGLSQALDIVLDIAGILMGPIGALIAIITIVSLAMTAWQQNLFGVRDKVNALLLSLRPFWQLLIGLWQHLVNELKPAIDDLMPVIQLWIKNFNEAYIKTGILQTALKYIGIILGGIVLGAILLVVEVIKRVINVITFMTSVSNGAYNTFKKVALFITDTLIPSFARFGDRVGKIFGSISGAISGAFKSGLNSVIDFINKAIRGFNSLATSMNKLPGPDVSTIPEIARLARGTASFKGGMALVGERGPELVSMPTGAAITPAEQTSKMLNGGGGVTINVNIPLFMGGQAEKRRVAEEIWKGISELARAQGKKPTELLNTPL